MRRKNTEKFSLQLNSAAEDPAALGTLLRVRGSASAAERRTRKRKVGASAEPAEISPGGVGGEGLKPGEGGSRKRSASRFLWQPEALTKGCASNEE